MSSELACREVLRQTASGGGTVKLFDIRPEVKMAAQLKPIHGTTLEKKTYNNLSAHSH